MEHDAHPVQPDAEQPQTEGQVFDLIEDVERRLEALRHAHKEAEDQRRVLSAREQELHARGEAAQRELETMREEQSELLKRAAAFRTAEERMEDRFEAFEDRIRELSSAKQTAEHERDEVREQVERTAEESAQAREEAERASQGAREMEHALRERERELQRVAEESAQQRDELRGQVDELEGRVAEREGELRRDLQRLSEERDRFRAELERVAQASSDKVAQARRERDELHEEHQRAVARTGEATRERDEASARAEDAEARLARMEEEQAGMAEQTRDETGRLAGELGSLREQLEQRELVLRELAQQHDELRTRHEEACQQLEGAQARAEHAEQSSGERSQASEALQAQLDEASKRAEQVSAQLESAEQQRDEAIQEAESHQEAVVRLEGQLQSATEGQGAEASALHEECETLRAGLEEASGVRDRLESELRLAAQDTAQQLEQQAQQHDAALEAAVEAAIESARESANESAHQHGPAVNDEAAQLRRSRLRRYRALVREQSDKIRQASEVLAQRVSATEQILRQRGELAAVKLRLDDQRRKVERAQATSRTMLTLVSMLLIVGMLGALSWAAARQVVPGTYAATARLGINEDLAPDDATLAGWGQAHAELIEDPRLHRAVAEKMSRRGLASLGTPGAVTEMVKSDLSVDTSAPGVVSLELRGTGRLRTQRQLETLTTSLIAQANVDRLTRPDGLVTRVADQPKATDDPIDMGHLYVAGGIFGAGSLVTLALGGLIWRRMADAKTRFEQDAKIDAILEESRWSDPTQEWDSNQAA